MSGSASRPKKLVGLYPGTFDPVTLGHIDIAKRAVKLVDHLVIGLATGTGKTPLFSLEERTAMWMHEAKHITGGQATIEVVPFENELQVALAHKVGAAIVIRGLRAMSDFEYEFQIAGMNQRLAPDIETVFLMATERHQFIASRLVKEIALLGGDISSFVPPLTLERLLLRIRG